MAGDAGSPLRDGSGHRVPRLMVTAGNAVHHVGRRLAPVPSALSQPTRLIAQRLVTAAVASYDPYRPAYSCPGRPPRLVRRDGKKGHRSDRRATVSQRSQGPLAAQLERRSASGRIGQRDATAQCWSNENPSENQVYAPAFRRWVQFIELTHHSTGVPPHRCSKIIRLPIRTTRSRG